MPRRTDAPPPRAPQSEPFETTGAFALPADAASGFSPANDPRSPFQPPQGQRGDEAGPMETTGAFARPPEWGPPADRSFNGPEGPADQTAVFGAPGGMPAPGTPGSGHASAFSRPADDGRFGEPAGRPYTGPADQPGPYAGGPADPFAQDDRSGPFGGPDDRSGPFGGPDDGSGPFRGPDDRSGPFGGPDERTAFFDGTPDRSGFFDESDDRTARFDPPPVPSSGPPEPGDVKVAGSPIAAQAPAWANAETGFLGSGWSSDSGPGGPEEPPRDRRGRRKARRDDELISGASSGGGKGKVALLSVAAVAVVLGGTVAGVKFMSTAGGPDKCADTTCAAVQGATNRPGPEVSQPPVEETEPVEEEPSDEPVKDTGPAETPTPTVTYNARPRHTEPAAKPTPTKTKVKKSKEPAQEPAQEPVNEPDDVSLPQDTPLEEPSSVDADTGAAPTTTSVPEPTDDTGSFGSPSGNGSVNVQQTIRQRMTTYAADLRLSNTSSATLQNPTITVPVDGTVVDVRGAQWTQDGDLLILDVSAQLATGDTVKVSFTATGRGTPAANCGMVRGECVVS
ncbi:hypothetical protein E1295_02825 [Nonomuraea mesophila]|uniref:CBM2 domain-containing protein n=1 Tax=Nonomuraea mesophila TaxID=2530382 RepID=A0A4R5FWP6_9ACTN|nr:hypothetical protein [Nonomuraea mesophila]TDE59499.1 hypothetical protein E1295_02825 [Nonomuraea mesophila]